MCRLVMIGCAAVRSLLAAAIVLTASNALPGRAEAAQAMAQPQLSFTCQFSTGPRTGQSQSYAGVAGIEAAPVGTFCADGQGSTGTVVPDVPLEPPAPVQPRPVAVAPPTTFICRFANGPRAGQVQSYAGVTGMQPIAVGAACTDGQGSTGVAIAEPPPPPPPPPPAPTTSSTCQFNNGPRAGQIQSYAGVTGIQPIPIGAPCTDGQGSTGVAVPDPSIQPARTAVPPPVAPPIPVPPPASAAGITGSSGGAPVREDRGATGPDNVAYVTYTGRRHARAASGNVETHAPDGIAQGPAVITGAAVGAAVRGVRGAVWADPKNIGYATGYTNNGRYYPGLPPGYGGSAAPPPPPSPPSLAAPTVPPMAWSGERG